MTSIRLPEDVTPITIHVQGCW